MTLVLRDNMINLLPLTVQLEGLLYAQFNYFKTGVFAFCVHLQREIFTEDASVRDQ